MMIIPSRIRPMLLAVALASLALAGAGCEETSLNWGLHERTVVPERPVERQITVNQLARRLDLAVIQPGPDVVRLQNRANTVTIFADPYGAAYVNGDRVPSGGRIELAGPSLMVPATLVDSIRNAMRTEAPPPRPAPRPDPLSGRRWRGTVILDAGHGGKDPGAMGAGGDREADIVLAVMRETATALQDRGVKVLLTRDDDTFVELDDRVSFAERHRPDLFVSIHVDAAGNTQACGYTVYVPRRAGADAPSEQAGEAIARSLERAVAVSRGVRRHAKNLRVLEKTSVPAVLVELGFITNAGECRLLLRREYQARLAGALAGGIEAWLRQR